MKEDSIINMQIRTHHLLVITKGSRCLLQNGEIVEDCRFAVEYMKHIIITIIFAKDKKVKMLIYRITI